MKKLSEKKQDALKAKVLPKSSQKQVKGGDDIIIVDSTDT